MPPPDVAEIVAQPYKLERPDTKACGELLRELTPLMVKCWQPHLNTVGMSFNPDWLRMVKMLGTGELLIFTARVDGKIAGFQMWNVSDYYYSMGTRVAICHRVYGGSKQGVNAREFVRFALAELKRFGVRTAYFSCVEGSAAERLYLDLGAQQQEVLLGMDLWR